MQRKPDSHGGFTLIEVVVTLAVLSISLTVLYQVFSSVARGTRVSADYYRALEIAETQMALLSTRMNDYAGTSGTAENGFRWQASASRYNPPVESPLAGDELVSAEEQAIQPYLLTVRVSWGEERKRNLELATIRLGSGL